MAGHTVTAYDRELDALVRAVAEMGGLARQMVIDSVDSLIVGDAARAHEVVSTGRRFGERRRRTEYDAVLTIARRSPVAVDLRDVIAAIRISGDLGRVASHAQSIANSAIRIGAAARVPRAILGLRHMKALAVDLLGDAIGAYARRDAEPARSVWMRDADLDSLEGSVVSDLLSQMVEDPRGISFCVHTLSAARAIERIGDHATNIAETVIYLVTGVSPPDERPRGRGPAAIDPEVDADAF